jgi:hypothetical protein
MPFGPQLRRHRDDAGQRGRPAVRSPGTGSGRTSATRRHPSHDRTPPAPRTQAGAPGYGSDPEVTIMTLTINDTTMTSDRTTHTARQAPGPQPGWEVSWLPDQTLDRNTAITAMTLADLAGEQNLYQGHRLWPHVQSWAAELGLTAPDAIERATQPPRDINPHQERATGQPDLEAAD